MFDEVCGYLPEITDPGKWYDVECWDPIDGNSVKIATTDYTYLHIAEVEVYGYFEQSTLSNYMVEQGKCRLASDLTAMGETYYLSEKNEWTQDYLYNPVDSADVCAKSCDANSRESP